MKKIAGCEFLATFEGCFFMFSWAKINFFELIFLRCRVRTKKLLDTRVNKVLKKIGKYCFGFKNWFF